MNRLQKKCFIVSLGIHLLLPVGILIAGAAFFSAPKTDTGPVDNFIAAQTVDAAISGGGDNSVKQPPAQLVTPPEPVAPQAPVVPPTPVTPPPVAERTPPVERSRPRPRETPVEVKPPKNDAPAIETPRKQHKIVPDLAMVTTSSADIKAAQAAARKAAAAAKRREAEAVSRALAGIRGGVSGSTEIKLEGPGGGVPYGNFLAQVKRAYFDAWIVPEGVPNVTVKAKVTIARDGTVISARITDASGTAAADDSVQRALDRVKFATPLPDGAKEDQRTVTINFNTEAKLEG